MDHDYNVVEEAIKVVAAHLKVQYKHPRMNKIKRVNYRIRIIYGLRLSELEE